MGCVESVPARTSRSSRPRLSSNHERMAPYKDEADDTSSEASDAEDAAFDAWDAMEQAEELSYLEQQLKGCSVDELMTKRFPTRGGALASPRGGGAAAHSQWSSVAAALTYDGDFALSPPYTLKKAGELYSYLRSPNAKPLPRKMVYEMLIAASHAFEAQAAACGSLIHVPPPAKPGERLLVCGDTHGQLQDVLVIFEEHGLPAPGNAYLFNGDIADRGRNATEIFVLLLAFKLACPDIMHINRGNHEQRDLNERPFANGGGFAWEVRAKYPHDELLIDLFQNLFTNLPIASLVGEWALVIHGGLFRENDVTLDDIRAIDACRQPPSVLQTRDDTLLFDALWADPHDGDGIVASDNRGGVSIQFGRDLTKAFCARNGVQSIIRSHQLPKRKRGYEIQHDAMLLTIFSASNYGGVCGNRGGVLVFDDRGPAEVKEFYAPPLDEYRALCEERALLVVMPRIAHWLACARLGPARRPQRQQSRGRRAAALASWRQLLYRVSASGVPLSPRRRRSDGPHSSWDLSPSRAALRADAAPAAEPISPRRSESLLDSHSPRHRGRGSSKQLLAQTFPPSRGLRPVQSMSPRVPRGKPADEPSGRRPLLRAQTVYDGSSCAGQRRVVRHSLISVPLRPSVAERRSSGDLVPGGHRIERVVYCEEEDNTILVDDDILQAMRMLICRSKSQLTRAFVAAEQQSAHRQATAHRGAAAPAVSLRRHVLPYAQWEAALAAQFPEYGALWPAYAPRLLATAAEAGTSGEGVPGGQVQYMLWLDRFQVRLPCGRFEEFEHSVLSRLHRALLARSREMSLAELLSYFDPATRSGARQCEVLQVLGSFNLGLSSRQLRQLVYDLGYADPRHPAEPVEVLRALLVVASPEMQAGQGEGEGDRRSSGGRSDGSDFISPRNSCGREARRHLRELRSTLRASRAQVYGALCGGSLLAILRRSEADGALSYPDVCELLMALQSACGVSVVARGAMERLVQHIDLSRAGRVSYLEFVAAFGLPESDEGAAARRRSRRSRRSSVYARRSSAQSDAELEDASARFGLKVMQAILSALYDRTPVMQKAFRHLDESGTGFLAEHDFEQALEVVLAHERAEHDVLQREQVHALVLSLRGSRLTDAEGRIDYPAFIQSFVVVDTLNAM